MEMFQIKQSNLVYPSSFQKYFARHAPAVITGLGNFDNLKQKKLAFFCSVKCPGHLILKAHDLSESLKQTELTVVGGFHSPIEPECLRILLRRKQPVIVCPARGLKGMNEELYFIINYGIKYRMGLEGEGTEEGDNDRRRSKSE